MLIGSDPEFAIVDGDVRVNAKDIILPIYESETLSDYDDNDILDFLNTSEIGIDHNGRVGELRAGPGTPITHFNNIRALVSQLKSVVPPNLNIIAGSYCKDVPLGGHIHFGSDFENYNAQTVSQILTWYVGVPLLMLEKPEDAEHRRCHSYSGNYYGTVGSIEENYQYDDEEHCEWKVPPSWLVAEHVTKGVLCLAYVIATDIGLLKHSVIDVEDFYHCRKNKYISLLNEIFNTIRELPAYSKYSKTIPQFLGYVNYCVQHNECWNVGDIRNEWS